MTVVWPLSWWRLRTRRTNCRKKEDRVSFRTIFRDNASYQEITVQRGSRTSITHILTFWCCNSTKCKRSPPPISTIEISLTVNYYRNPNHHHHLYGTKYSLRRHPAADDTRAAVRRNRKSPRPRPAYRWPSKAYFQWHERHPFLPRRDQRPHACHPNAAWLGT